MKFSCRDQETTGCAKRRARQIFRRGDRGDAECQTRQQYCLKQQIWLATVEIIVPLRRKISRRQGKKWRVLGDKSANNGDNQKTGVGDVAASPLARLGKIYL